MLLTDDIQQIVRQHLAGEIVCQTIPGDLSRVGCITPLQYPSGDSITIWIEQIGSEFRISDYGEAFLDVLARRRRDQTEMDAIAADIGASWGVDVKKGALVVGADLEGLGDAVWRAATVAHQVAEVAHRFRAPRSQNAEREHHFVQEVENELRTRHLRVEREVRLNGGSGHEHKATLFVPGFAAILEPIHAPAHFNQISSVYTKFGDLSRVTTAEARAFQRFSLIDDRTADLSEDLASMLVQVSDLVRWTRRDEWLGSFERAS